MQRYLLAFMMVATLSGGRIFAANPVPADVGEWGLETDTIITMLPSVAPSSMVARACLQCKEVSLQVSAATQFYAGQDPISLNELKRAAQSRHFMMVFYKPATRVVTRIVIHGISAAAIPTR
jgi:hypothetical protein